MVLAGATFFRILLANGERLRAAEDRGARGLGAGGVPIFRSAPRHIDNRVTASIVKSPIGIPAFLRTLYCRARTAGGGRGIMLRSAERRLEFRSVGFTLILGMWLLAAGVSLAQNPAAPTPAPAPTAPAITSSQQRMAFHRLRGDACSYRNEQTERCECRRSHDARHGAYI